MLSKWKLIIMTKITLHEKIRALERKRFLAYKAAANQRRRELSGKPIKVHYSKWTVKIQEIDNELHELKLKR